MSKASEAASAAASGFLASMEKLLHLLGQPVELRRLNATSVLLLGPYQLPNHPDWPGHVLSICYRRQMEKLLGLPSSGGDLLDFHLRCPFQLDPARQQEVAWLVGFLNLWLPLGSFQLPREGRPLMLYELNLQKQELPASVFLETTALLLDGFAQGAPLLQAVSSSRLRAEDVRAWLNSHKLEPSPLHQVLKSRRQPAPLGISSARVLGTA